ncbi:MAG: DUF2634 domain-containing protein [Defluviitaleaceae bacterium]|nr:DUF2634 domain-containing protein [Defluviitaleaceae bacterium]
MIPALKNEVSVQYQANIQPSLTYRMIDVMAVSEAMDTTDITGDIDGLEALKQTCEHILGTERGRYPIYSANYGAEMEQFKSRGFLFLRAVIPQVIRDALTQDDRVTNVVMRQITHEGIDGASVLFDIISPLGVISNFNFGVKHR